MSISEVVHKKRVIERKEVYGIFTSRIEHVTVCEKIST